MSAVVECPACHESLELPEEFMEGVVCPHCEAAFILKPVLLNEHGEPIEDAPASAAAAASGPASGVTAGEEAADARKESTTESGSPGVSDIAAAAAAAEAKAAASASDEKAADTEQESKDDASKDQGDDSDSPWAGLGQADTGGGESTSSKDSMSAKAVRQRQNQGPSMLSLAIGVVLSGFVGLYLGYWLLNYFGGPRFHFIDLPLPFVDHSRSAQSDSDDFPAPPPGGGPITIESPRSKQPPKRNRKPANDKQGQATPAAEMPVVTTQPPVEEPAAPQGTMPSFSAQDLADVLTQANRATSTPGGDVEVTSELYEQLCRLAQVATFVDVNEPQVLARREAVHTVLRRVTHRLQQLAAINAFAQARLAAAAQTKDPAASPGIVLAGQVVGSSSSGPWQLTRVQLLHVAAKATPARPAPDPVPSGTPLESQLPGSASGAMLAATHVALQAEPTLVQNPAADSQAAVTLVSSGRIPLQPGASRLFVGSIISHPRQALPGYTLDDSPVVWAGTWVALASDAS